MEKEIYKTSGAGGALLIVSVFLFAIGVICFPVMFNATPPKIVDDEGINMVIHFVITAIPFGAGLITLMTSIRSYKSKVVIYPTYIEGKGMVQEKSGSVPMLNNFSLMYYQIDSASTQGNMLIITTSSVKYKIATSRVEAKEAWQIINQQMRAISTDAYQSHISNKIQ